MESIDECHLEANALFHRRESGCIVKPVGVAAPKRDFCELRFRIVCEFWNNSEKQTQKIPK